MENYCDAVMKSLDEKYGNNRKIVGMVLCDIKSLKKVNYCDNKEFVRIFEKVETSWLDLNEFNS